MVKKKMPRSIRKFIRKEKARIRRDVLGSKEQERQIYELLHRFFLTDKTNKQQN